MENMESLVKNSIIGYEIAREIFHVEFILIRYGKYIFHEKPTDDDNTKEIIVCNIIYNYNYLLNILDFHRISKVQN